jgi:hypothetical protein
MSAVKTETRAPLCFRQLWQWPHAIEAHRAA